MNSKNDTGIYVTFIKYFSRNSIDFKMVLKSVFILIFPRKP